MKFSATRKTLKLLEQFSKPSGVRIPRNSVLDAMLLGRPKRVIKRRFTSTGERPSTSSESDILVLGTSRVSAKSSEEGKEPVKPAVQSILTNFNKKTVPFSLTGRRRKSISFAFDLETIHSYAPVEVIEIDSAEHSNENQPNDVDTLIETCAIEQSENNDEIVNAANHMSNEINTLSVEMQSPPRHDSSGNMLINLSPNRSDSGDDSGDVLRMIGFDGPMEQQSSLNVLVPSGIHICGPSTSDVDNDTRSIPLREEPENLNTEWFNINSINQPNETTSPPTIQFRTLAASIVYRRASRLDPANSPEQNEFHLLPMDFESNLDFGQLD